MGPGACDARRRRRRPRPGRPSRGRGRPFSRPRAGRTRRARRRRCGAGRRCWSATVFSLRSGPIRARRADTTSSSEARVGAAACSESACRIASSRTSASARSRDPRPRAVKERDRDPEGSDVPGSSRRRMEKRHERCPALPQHGRQRGRGDHGGPASGSGGRRFVAGRGPAEQRVPPDEKGFAVAKDERPVRQRLEPALVPPLST